MPLAITTSGALWRGTREQVKGHLATVVQHGNAAAAVERLHSAAGHELDIPLGEGRHQASDVFGKGVTGVLNEITIESWQESRMPRVTGWSCSSRAASLGAGGASEARSRITTRRIGGFPNLI